MDNDLHIILPGILYQDLEEIIEYSRLLEPFMFDSVPSSFNDVVIEAILYFKSHCIDACEYYGLLDVKF